MTSRLSLCALSCIAAACGTVEDEFRDALPLASELSITVPSAQPAQAPGRSSQALLGERAYLYTLTRQVSGQLNAMVWVGLQLIGSIVEQPPTSVAKGVATWGPHTPALESLTWTLVVTRKGPGQHAYVLAARHKDDSEGEFLPIIVGASSRGRSSRFSGYHGAFTANATNLHQLDAESHPDTGAFVATYDTRGDQRTVKLAMKDYAAVGEQPSSVLYSYLERADTSGEFGFVAHADVDENGSANELAAIRSAWDNEGAGRGQALVTGGDVPAGFAVAITECWGDDFGRVFYVDNAEIHPTEGDIAQCAFDELD